MQVEVQGTRKLQQRLERMTRQADAAARRAINRTLTRANTYTAQQIGQQINLKAAEIKRQLTRRKAKGRNLTASLAVDIRGESKTQGTPLLRFGAKEVRKGVSVKVKRKAGRKVIPGAFILEPKQGGAVVAIRRTAKRTPLDFPYGPGVFQLWRNGQRRSTRREARRFMQIQLDKELKRALENEWTR